MRKNCEACCHPVEVQYTLEHDTVKPERWSSLTRATASRDGGVFASY
jgi:hypothetical protein